MHELLLINTLEEVTWPVWHTIHLYEQQKSPVKGNENDQRSQKYVHGRKVEEVGFVQPREVRAEGQSYNLFMKILVQRGHEYLVYMITTDKTRKQISR